MKHRLIPTAAALAFLAGSALAEDVRVYNWSDYIDEELLTKFTADTGLNLIYDVFDSCWGQIGHTHDHVSDCGRAH